MSYLQEAAAEHEEIYSGVANTLIADAAGAMFWRWFDDKGKHIRIKVRVAFLRPSVKLGALENVFAMIFPRPTV
jgi:hypothetical protein